MNYSQNFRGANPSPPERWGTKQHTECDNEKIGPYVNYKKINKPQYKPEIRVHMQNL